MGARAGGGRVEFAGGGLYSESQSAAGFGLGSGPPALSADCLTVTPALVAGSRSRSRVIPRVRIIVGWVGMVDVRFAWV